ncbi:sulfite exporter TauE/SafE family protein [Streptosporangium saharense]|uniref:sulfite exporter TauE/SafE family protein n=1 Tax=Streptosporangium saharense TaxID=1706840 RepID=UPI0036B4F0E4
MTIAEALLVTVAGLLAGAVNTVAGGGTLITYPVLLLCGLPPVSANITSAIGLAPGYAGGAYAYRRELGGQRARQFALGPTAIVGGVAGAALLLVTPPGSFQVAVPFLVLASCLLLLAQPVLASAVARRTEQSRTEQSRTGQGQGSDRVTPLAHAGVFVASVYGAYFSAGLGVLLLAVLGIVFGDGLQRLNGLKSALSLVIVLTAVVIYAASGQASFGHTLLLLVASCLGGTAGGAFARRLDAEVLRRTVAILGTVLAVVLFLKG